MAKEPLTLNLFEKQRKGVEYTPFSQALLGLGIVLVRNCRQNTLSLWSRFEQSD